MAVRSIEEVKGIVRRYSEILVKEGFPIERILLFGSYSRNEQNENSDIDIAVVLSKYFKDKFNTRLALMRYTRDFDEIIEPHPFLASEFDESDPFANEILKTGETIFS